MLMLADKDGCVYGSIPGIAHTARVSVADCETAIREFQQPDCYNNLSHDGSGRYIEFIDGGFKILDWPEYDHSRLPWEEWAPLRALVFERDNFTCQYCGIRGVRLECDHIVPIASGGANDLENLTTACVSCNRSKGAKSLEMWLQ